MPYRPRIDRVFIHACTIAALAWSAAQLIGTPVDGRFTVLALGSVVLLYAGIDLRVGGEKRHTVAHARSMHTAIAAMLLLLVGPWLTVVATAIASVVRDVSSGRSARKLVGNLSTRALPVFCAGMAWHLMRGNIVDAYKLPDAYPALAVTLTVFALVHEFGYAVDAFARTNSDGHHPRWRDELRRLPDNLVACLLQAFVGGGIAALVLANPWSAPLVVPIAASAYLALERGSRVEVVTERALDTFARIVDERDTYTFEHSDRVCEYSVAIGREMGLSERELEALYWTSRLHDLGKVAIDNSILNKPGSLTSDEFDVMKQHPETSARILASFSFDAYDTEVVRCHHERYDGRGYLGRTRDEVPREAFIIAVADAYDAMTSSRPYRDALPREIALREIELGIGTQFHPEAVVAFLVSMGVIDRADRDARTLLLARAEVSHDEATPRHRVDMGDDLRDVA